MNTLYWALPLAYLIGAIPFGRLVGIAALHKELASGVGNPGPFVFMVTGRRYWAAAVWLLEAGKIVSVVALGVFILTLPIWQVACLMFAATFGHMFSVFSKFRPCRNLVAQSGAWLAAHYGVFLVLGVVWLFVVWRTGRPVLASWITLGLSPLIAYPFSNIYFAVALLALAILDFLLGRRDFRSLRLRQDIHWRPTWR